jgi:hypothetical protein
MTGPWAVVEAVKGGQAFLQKRSALIGRYSLTAGPETKPVRES